MEYGDAVRLARLDATASLPLEYDDNGFGEPSGYRRSTNSLDEGSGCSWSIPPPAVGT
jgi:hypothetical protein